jgi:agmatine/peptidylarginine deiminase
MNVLTRIFKVHLAICIVTLIGYASAGAVHYPAGLTVRMPAEYEPLSAVLIRWQPKEGVSPQNSSVGQGANEDASIIAYNKLVLSLIESVTGAGIDVRIFIPDDGSIEDIVKECLAGSQNAFCDQPDVKINLNKIELVKADGNSVWIRDYGPFSVIKGTSRRQVYVDPTYYAERAFDDVIPLWAGLTDGMPPIERLGLGPLDDGGFSFQGGNLLLDNSGERAFISDHAIIQNQIMAEKQGLVVTAGEIRENIEQAFLEKLGIEDIVVLPGGEQFPINLDTKCANDDALGCTFHIDMGMKILPGKRVIISQYNENDAGCVISVGGITRNTCSTANAILNQWSDFFNDDGYRVFRVVNPPNGYDPIKQQSLVYSYANSLIVKKNLFKKKMIVPIYTSGENIIPDGTGRTYNESAVDTYRSAFGPYYDIDTVLSDYLVPFGGSIHCITMQVPKQKNAKGDLSESVFSGEPNSFMVIGSWLERGRSSIYIEGELNTKEAYPTIIAEQLGLSVGLNDSDDFVLGDMANFYSNRIFSNLSTQLSFVKSLDKHRSGDALVRSELLFPDEPVKSRLDLLMEAGPEVILLQLGGAEVAANLPLVSGPRVIPLSKNEFEVEAGTIIDRIANGLPDSKVILTNNIDIFGVVDTLAALGALGPIPPGWSIQEFVNFIFDQFTLCPFGDTCIASSRQALDDYNSVLIDIANQNALALADVHGFYASATGIGQGIDLGGIYFDFQSSFILLLQPDQVVNGLPGILTPLAKAVSAYLAIEALNNTYNTAVPLPDLCTFEPVPTLIAFGHPLFPPGHSCNP